MGMTIEESLKNLKALQTDYRQFHDDVWQDPESFGIMAESLQVAINTMSKYQQLQAAYEARLKADLKAILVELQLEIEEKAIELCDDGWWLTYNEIIQEKIDKLKENKE